MGCPCKEGRYGAFALVVSIYWAMQCGGIGATLNLVTAGTALGVWWAIWTGIGVGSLAEGIRQARSHDDNFDGRSVLVSVGLIGLALWAFAHHWFFLTDDWVGHASRVFWFGLLGSEAFNLWLNFRGRRHTPEIQERRSSGFFGRGRRVRVGIVYENRRLDDAPDYLAAPPHASPVLEHNGEVPQLVYVQDGNGNFIPVQLPPVPVGRRLR
jgi:hypothetical protein